MFSHKINFSKSCVEFPIREIAKHFKDRPKKVIDSYPYFNLLDDDLNLFAELCILEYMEKNI